MRTLCGIFDAAVSMLTHSYVLAEFVPLASTRRLPRPSVMQFVHDLQNSGMIDVVYIGEQLHRAAVGMLQNRLDKQWSLCDATSFLLMDLYGETQSLTTDHHFEQAGFIRLLK